VKCIRLYLNEQLVEEVVDIPFVKFSKIQKLSKNDNCFLPISKKDVKINEIDMRSLSIKCKSLLCLFLLHLALNYFVNSKFDSHLNDYPIPGELIEL
jgi:hypothetical protein